MTARMLEAGIAGRPVRGEKASGDAAVVRSLPDGALIAAVDGLGHGPPAAVAAGAAASVLEAFAAEPVVSLATRCHDALRGTRGAALSLAAYSARNGSVTWLGVGNVEGRLVRCAPHGSAESLASVPGTLGEQLPTLRAATLDVELGDTLVFATDGVDWGFADSLDVSGPAQRIAERILDEHGHEHDDALVVVARFLGGRQ